MDKITLRLIKRALLNEKVLTHYFNILLAKAKAAAADTESPLDDNLVTLLESLGPQAIAMLVKLLENV